MNDNPLPPGKSEEECKQTASEAVKPESVAPHKQEHEDRKSKVLRLVTDSVLVLLITAAIGASGYYLKQQYQRFRVPTPMEMVMQENEQLCNKHEALREKAFHADEQLHMRRRLAHQERRLGRDSQQIADLEASIAEQRSRILAIQHEIRSADKEYRSVARSLLPGMPIGNATTTTGKAYRNAVIYRIDNKNVVLRTPEGQSRFPVRQLVKDNLPPLARYAFGLDNLVDMSDFDTAESLDAPVKQEATPIADPAPTPAPASEKRAETSYEPEEGAPVVDTDASSTTTNTGDDSDSAQVTDDGLAPW